MVTVTEFLSRLISSIGEMIVIFVRDVATQDPLSFVSLAVGALFVTIAVVYFAYLVLGAAADAVGLITPTK